MNIIILMAGLGLRVSDFFKKPKPMIEVNGKTLAELSASSLGIDGKYIFVTRRFTEFEEDWNAPLNDILREAAPGCQIVELESMTRGAAETALKAFNYISSSEPVIVSNCDHILSWDSALFENHIKGLDGCVTTYPHDGIIVGEKSPYSFARLENERVVEMKEKFAISSHALNGIHYWKKGEWLIESTLKMIEQNERCNGEFYISQTYNHILDKNIGIFPMQLGEFIPLGTTEEILSYLDSSDKINL